MKSKELTTPEQPELRLARRVEKQEVAIELVMRQRSLAAAIALCISLSGLKEKEIYITLGIDAGHWTRICKGEAHFPVDKLNDLMDLCGNEAPLMWLAHSRGKGLVLLKSEAERQLEAVTEALHRERDKLRLLTEVLQGKSN